MFNSQPSSILFLRTTELSSMTNFLWSYNCQRLLWSVALLQKSPCIVEGQTLNRASHSSVVDTRTMSSTFRFEVLVWYFLHASTFFLLPQHLYSETCHHSLGVLEKALLDLCVWAFWTKHQQWTLVQWTVGWLDNSEGKCTKLASMVSYPHGLLEWPSPASS